MPILDNQKHEKFAQIVATGESAGRAHQKVYHAKDSTSETEGPKLLRNPQIRARVTEIQGKAESSAVLTIAEKRKFLADILRTPIGEIDESSPLAQSYEYTTLPGDDVRELHKLKVPCKLKALELDAKLAGEFNEKITLEAGDSITEIMREIRGRRDDIK